jgi:hypothetical protein
VPFVCFSAEASFGAAAALTGIGVLSVRGAPTARHVPLAAVPFVFAVQQASEGALWMELANTPFGKTDGAVVRVFLFFALFVWPAYLPASLTLIQPAGRRRALLALLTLLGAALGGYLMACASLRESDACIAYANLYYWVQIDVPFKPIAPYAYVALVAAPLVVSSVRGTSIFAGAVLVSFALTGALYPAGFLSVWCFVAALLSGIAAIVVRLAPRAGPPLSIAGARRARSTTGALNR